MLDLFASAFVTLFVVIDPPGCAPIYAGLTRGADEHQRRSMAIRAALIATLILLGFALFGEPLLAALHIDLDSFRIAGGIMLFIIALEMVLERRTQRREERAERVRAQNAQSPEVDDVAVFPMAMPMIAGPGAIATIMLLASRAQGLAATAAVLGALATVMLLTLAALLAAGRIVALLGSSVESAVTRLLGVLLAALAAQYVIDGVRGSFGI
jgi:multiple antibiotic resistance protein